MQPLRPIPPSRPWFCAPPPGAGFARLARTPLHRWWRPPLGTLVLLAAWGLLGFAVAGVLGVFGYVQDSRADTIEDSVAYLAYSLAVIAVAIPATMLAAGWIQRRPVGTLSSVVGRLRWRWLATCLGLAVLAMFVNVFLSAAVQDPADPVTDGDAWVGWGEFLPAAAVVVLLVPVQASAEEYVFRGWVVQAIGAFLRSPWPGVVVSALLFSAAHGFDLGPWTLIDIGMLAATLGWLAVRTGGLEAGIALHVVNNMVGLLAAAAFGSLDVRSLQRVDASTALVDIVVYLLFAWLVMRLFSRRDLAHEVPASLEEDRPRTT